MQDDELIQKDTRKDKNILFHDNSYRNRVVKKKLKSLFWSIFVLGSWLLASFLLVRLVLILGALMWAGTAIVAHILKAERKNIINRGYQTFLTWSWGLMGYRFLLNKFMNIPVEEWTRALQVEVPSAFTTNFSGYLMILFAILLIGVPIGYAGYLSSKFFIFTSRKEVGERRKEVMRDKSNLDN